MKYEYGVEYETKGEKPDLPDDVLVHVMAGGEWNDYGDKYNAVENWNWDMSQKFRIVDERYKPKPSDWYKLGELPPVGTECLADFLPNEVMANDKRVDDGHCLIRGYNGNMVWLQWCEGDNFVNRVENFDFRPLRTEHDVLVEKAEMDIHQKHSDMIARHHIQALIGAGWRPVKQQTEDEFVDEVRSRLNVFKVEYAHQLYRAGCRFIDVGE